MKKLNLVLILILILILLAAAGIGKSLNKEEKKTVSEKETIRFELAGKSYQLLVADTPEEREIGLMGVRNRQDFDGMLFIFPEKSIQTFWNKNTLVDLDLYWLEGERVVGKGELPSIEKSQSVVTVTSPAAVNKVIEVIR